MTGNRLSTLCLTAAMTLIAPAGFGHDLGDFLRAVNGVRHHRDHDRRHRDHHHGRGWHDSRSQRIGSHGYRPHRRFVSIHFGHYTPSLFHSTRPLIVGPLPQAPPPSMIDVLPHELGETVNCDVPLTTHVRVRDAHEIAPGAQPVVVAIRDPHLTVCGSPGCIERVAYIQVFAPPVPAQEITVSPCRTRIELDYGDWEIKIRSCDGVIEVEYDD